MIEVAVFLVLVGLFMAHIFIFLSISNLNRELQQMRKDYYTEYKKAVLDLITSVEPKEIRKRIGEMAKE